MTARHRRERDEERVALAVGGSELGSKWKQKAAETRATVGKCEDQNAI